MSDTMWTWTLFFFEIVGITGMWFVGRKQWWGWGVVLVHSIPWFIYSIIFNKPGFIAMSFLWWTVNFINMTKWYNENRVAQKDQRLTQGLSDQGLSTQDMSTKDKSNPANNKKPGNKNRATPDDIANYLTTLPPKTVL